MFFIAKGAIGGYSYDVVGRFVVSLWEQYGPHAEQLCLNPWYSNPTAENQNARGLVWTERLICFGHFPYSLLYIIWVFTIKRLRAFLPGVHERGESSLHSSFVCRTTTNLLRTLLKFLNYFYLKPVTINAYYCSRIWARGENWSTYSGAPKPSTNQFISCSIFNCLGSDGMQLENKWQKGPGIVLTDHIKIPKIRW